MRCLLMLLSALAVALASAHAQESKYYDLPNGDYPHDVAVGPMGEVWYAGQNLGIAGRLNPVSGDIERISLGKKSAPHGVTEQRIAIGCFTKCRPGPDEAAAAGAVFHNDLLAPELRKCLRDQSMSNVGARSRRQRYDQFHGSCRIKFS